MPLYVNHIVLKIESPILEIKTSLEKSNIHYENQKSICEIKRTNFGNQKSICEIKQTNFRNKKNPLKNKNSRQLNHTDNFLNQIKKIKNSI